MDVEGLEVERMGIPDDLEVLLGDLFDNEVNTA